MKKRPEPTMWMHVFYCPVCDTTRNEYYRDAARLGEYCCNTLHPRKLLHPIVIPYEVPE